MALSARELASHDGEAEFVYRHAWRLGDLLIWDNTGTMRRAILYAADSGRRMHRASPAGEEAFA